MFDDVWCIYDEHDPGDLHPERWLGRVDQEWMRVGVQSHLKKSVNGKAGEEVHGGRVDGRAGTLCIPPDEV